MDKLKRSNDYVLNIREHERNENIICTRNGKLINLNTGEIKTACRNDLILNTSMYSLTDKEAAEDFMDNILELYKDILSMKGWISY